MCVCWVSDGMGWGGVGGHACAPSDPSPSTHLHQRREPARLLRPRPVLGKHLHVARVGRVAVAGLGRQVPTSHHLAHDGVLRHGQPRVVHALLHHEEVPQALFPSSTVVRDALLFESASAESLQPTNQCTNAPTSIRTRARALALSSSTMGGTIHRDGRALCCSSKVASAGMHSWCGVECGWGVGGASASTQYEGRICGEEALALFEPDSACR